MPPHPLPAHAALGIALITVVFCATLGAMVGAWSWAIGRLRTGRPLLPPPEPRTVPWGLGSVLVVLLLWLAVNLGVSIAFFRMSGHGANDWKPSPTQQMEMVSLINLILLVVIPPLLRLLSGATPDDLGIRPRGLSKQALAGVVGFLLVTPAVYLLNFLAVRVWEPNRHPVEKMMLGEPTVEVALLAFLSAVILAPAAEELIFRGILQGWLAKLFRRQHEETGRGLADSPELVLESIEAPSLQAGGVDDGLTESAEVPEPSLEPDGGTAHVAFALARAEAPGSRRTRAWLLPRLPGTHAKVPGFDWPSIAPIVITSAIFAAVHLPQWPAPLAIFFLAMGLGLVYQRTGSLLASFVMHALFNGISTMLLFQQMLLGHPVDPKAAPTATYSTIAGPAGSVARVATPRPTSRRP